MSLMIGRESMRPIVTSDSGDGGHSVIGKPRRYVKFGPDGLRDGAEARDSSPRFLGEVPSITDEAVRDPRRSEVPRCTTLRPRLCD